MLVFILYVILLSVATLRVFKSVFSYFLKLMPLREASVDLLSKF